MSTAVEYRKEPRRSVAAAYFALTKPRVVELLLVTTVPAMAVAASGWPGAWPVVATLVGGALCAGGANALNSYLDRDIDEKMRRTLSRPLPRHEIRPEQARRFGWGLGAVGFGWLWATVNWTAAALTAGAFLFYVFVYTLRLKRTTTQNIVIGGAAGAVPTLVGWAAVTGRLELPAWVMFAIVFAWTPAHFWALSLRYLGDYAAAGVPMLPVVRGVEVTTQRILAYAGTTVLFSLALVPVADMGWVYLVGAIGLGAWLMFEAFLVGRRPDRAMTLFVRSNTYLAALFGAMLIDRVLS